MLTHPTHERLIALGLTGMAKALDEQRRSPDLDGFVANLLFQSFSYRGGGLSGGGVDVQGQAFRQIRDPALRSVVSGLQSEPEKLRGDDG